MFLNFFLKLKDSKIPVSLNEFFIFLKALEKNFVQYDMDMFYYLSRTCLVKDERFFDQYDIIFANYFNSIENIRIEDVLRFLNLPKNWLKKIFERKFSGKELDKVKSLGNFDKLIETLKKRLEEQKKRHQGGSKWIGTSGTSPFGAYGYNPEGIRIGQNESRHRKAVKVWDKRIFKDFDDTKELNNRGFQVALKKLRQWARTGINEELDVDETITNTAKNGFLEIKTRKERENSIKIILFLDVGGSMNDHVEKVERLFNAAKNVFKNLNYFYFHNCLYEGVWKNNLRRWEERFSTVEILRSYGKEYKCIFVGDAAMSPYEILMEGGGNEHFNEESGRIWLERVLNKWKSCLWINPTPKEQWRFSDSTKIIQEIFDQRMVDLSIKGIEEGTKILQTKNF